MYEVLAEGLGFPGGHIEVDEGLDEGALREFHEETGVKVTLEHK